MGLFPFFFYYHYQEASTMNVAIVIMILTIMEICIISLIFKNKSILVFVISPVVAILFAVLVSLFAY